MRYPTTVRPVHMHCPNTTTTDGGSADIAGANICLTMTARMVKMQIDCMKQSLPSCRQSFRFRSCSRPLPTSCRQKKARIKIRAEDYHQREDGGNMKKTLNYLHKVNIRILEYIYKFVNQFFKQTRFNQ